jgi:hypothetical protein
MFDKVDMPHGSAISTVNLSNAALTLYSNLVDVEGFYRFSPLHCAESQQKVIPWAHSQAQSASFLI